MLLVLGRSSREVGAEAFVAFMLAEPSALVSLDRVTSLLRGAVDATHVRRARGVVRLPVDLRVRRGAAASTRSGCWSRCSTCCSRCRSSASCRSRSRASSRFSGSLVGLGAALDLRRFHEPGVEHGVLVLPVAADAAGRPRRGDRGLPPVRLQRFALELPAGTIGLVWNAMMSSAAAGSSSPPARRSASLHEQYTLPGIGDSPPPSRPATCPPSGGRS